MARPNRCEIVGDDEVAVLHVFSRCVRRAFLGGVDPLTGACYDHRKQFIQDRLEALAGVFAIDVMAYAIMSNHFHLVLRTRPDIVAQWSDEEVARRWRALFPKPDLNSFLWRKCEFRRCFCRVFRHFACSEFCARSGYRACRARPRVRRGEICPGVTP